MSWTTPDDIRSQIQRLWDQGRLLSGAVREAAEIASRAGGGLQPFEATPVELALTSDQEEKGSGGTFSDRGVGQGPGSRSERALCFPVELRFRRPSPRELSDRFDAVRTWIRGLEEGAKETRGLGYNITWEETNTRLLGRNRVPRDIVVSTREDALELIGKASEARRFEALARATLEAFPELADWLARKPLTALDHAEAWDLILGVLSWARVNPHSGFYLRQVDVPGVDTRFIEARKALFTELLDIVLAPDAFDIAMTGIRNFEARYGFASKPPLIRLRILDERYAIAGLTDLTVRADEFSRLDLGVERVFIAENEINGLAFPEVANSLVIFGLGYAVDLLSSATWLETREIHYWGDIDTHGFAMLDRLRARYLHAHGLLMDRETLLAHQRLWTEEGAPHVAPLDRLTPDEHDLYDDLRRDRLGRRVRLEQERVAFGRVVDCLQRLTASH